ncbi:hypothetical protein LQ567_03570 [Niabella pedocola]|uniref:DUF2938 domain-containing protein n=1 Tax=Niabella pedocola TaxID=1752077 RepID=A0ABS8PLS9_9BACT|nr:hypothetical protein [Niabella pedocola]MCD2421825.1 hypothetical protein [Niabella pedocola]
MALFTILDSILAGIMGTLAMTLFIRLTGMATGSPFSVPRILGSLLTSSTSPSGKASQRLPVLLLGTAVHYVIGILFTLFYAWLAGSGVLPEGYINGLLYGFNIGIVAVVTWYLALRLHPHPPAIPVRLFLVVIFTGHLVYAAVIVTTFHFLLTIF